MNEEQREAFVVSLVRKLAAVDWVGKTHIQKAVYFAQEAAGADLGFRYVIHYYGPYSRELDSLVQRLEAQSVLDVTPEPDGYGYEVALGETQLEEALEEYLQRSVDSIAKHLGGMKTLELERLSTAFYIRNRLPGADREVWVREVKNLKPKFSEEEIEKALDESKEIAEAIKPSG